MKCFSLLIGARNTAGAPRKFSKSDEQTIREITVKHFPNGFTLLNSEGDWFDPKKHIFIHEESRQILITTKKPKDLVKWIKSLGHALQQKELLVVELGRVHRHRVRIS